MAGHSKWHNIRLRKGKQDAVRSKMFTKLAREIIVAAKGGGGNSDANPRLRLAVQKARDNSMPADNIKRAIQRGTGEIEGANYEEITYEGYGPAGVALLVEVTTENRNRTVAVIRHAFSRNGGTLGESGCVSWLFDHKGILSVPSDAADENTVMTVALEAGADDVRTEEDEYEVITTPENFEAVKAAFEEAGVPVSVAEITMVPQNTIHLEGKEAQQMLRLMDALEDLDDVSNVYANFDISEDELEVAA
ncbi:MAG: YebC/PmpR family DNA-binding transcriptional regulator [Armatimonadetes bacterium]|nr:YebC/PmpR family DNA-binding transcriptional regulator [Armatimonadota bacterium]